MRVFFIIIFLFIDATLFCQTNKIHINLIVLDDGTLLPVPYVHLFIKGEHIGTITNEEGKVVFKIDSIYADDTIFLSCIGYETRNEPIKKLIDNAINEIRLEKQIYFIDDVEVASKISKSIVKSAIESILDNYPSEKYHFNGYFRTALKENEDFVRYLEASVNVFDKGFHKKKGVYAKINQLRKTNDFRNYKWEEGNNYLADCLYDPIRYREKILDIDYIDSWDFKIENVTYLDSSLVYNISFCLKDSGLSKFEGNILIRKYDYAILQLNYLDNLSFRMGNPNDSIKFIHLTTIISIRYKDFDNKLIKSHQSLVQRWYITDTRYNKIGEITLYEEFITYDVGYGRNMRSINHLNRNLDIYKIRMKYDKEFWNDFNIPVDTRSFQSAKAKINSRLEIEKQFEQNSKR